MLDDFVRLSAVTNIRKLGVSRKRARTIIVKHNAVPGEEESRRCLSRQEWSLGAATASGLSTPTALGVRSTCLISQAVASLKYGMTAPFSRRYT